MSHAPEHSSAPAEPSVAELMTQLSEQTSRLTAAVHGIIFSVVKHSSAPRRPGVPAVERRMARPLTAARRPR